MGGHDHTISGDIGCAKRGKRSPAALHRRLVGLAPMVPAFCLDAVMQHRPWETAQQLRSPKPPMQVLTMLLKLWPDLHLRDARSLRNGRACGQCPNQRAAHYMGY